MCAYSKNILHILYIAFTKLKKENPYNIYLWQNIERFGLDDTSRYRPVPFAEAWGPCGLPSLCASPRFTCSETVEWGRCSRSWSPGGRIKECRSLLPSPQTQCGPQRGCGWSSGPGAEVGRYELRCTGRYSHVHGFFGAEATKKGLQFCFLLNLKSVFLWSLTCEHLFLVLRQGSNSYGIKALWWTEPWAFCPSYPQLAFRKLFTVKSGLSQSVTGVARNGHILGCQQHPVTGRVCSLWISTPGSCGGSPGDRRQCGRRAPHGGFLWVSSVVCSWQGGVPLFQHSSVYILLSFFSQNGNGIFFFHIIGKQVLF